MAEAIVGSMLWKLQQVATREARTLVAVNEDIRSLRDKLMWMQAFLRDVQPSRRVQPNELIKVWLQQTRDAVFDAEDAVDLYFVQIDLSRFPSWSRAIFCFFASFTTQVVVRHDLSSRIRLINERLEGIIVNKDRYRLGESTTLGSIWRPSSSTSPLSEKMDDVELPLVGREELVRELKYYLYKSSVNHENVITVIGESGVGKTKLVMTSQLCRMFDACCSRITKTSMQLCHTLYQSCEPSCQEAAQVGEKPPNEAGGEQGGNRDGPCLYPVRYCPGSSIRGGNKKKKQAKSCVQDLLQNSRFLRVIHFNGLEVDKELPAEIGNVVNLQYIRVTSCSLEKIPSSIGRLCNLQTLDVRGTMVRSLPDGFWRIQTLRHVLGDRLILPKRVGDLRNLQTLNSIKPDYDGAHAWDDKTFTYMIRLLYLHIRHSESQGSQNIFSNHKNKAALVKAVSILKYLVVLIIKAPVIPSEVFTRSNLPRLKAMELVGKLDLPQNALPKMEVRTHLPNLKKLRLLGTEVSQEFINQLGDLQFLFTLELSSNSFKERNLIFKDGFHSLKELTVHDETINRLEIHEPALPELEDLDIFIHSSEFRVEIHGHYSKLMQQIEAEDEELFKITDVITRQVQVENNNGANSNA